MKRGMTAAAFQSLGISDDMKERLNRLVIGVATMAEHGPSLQCSPCPTSQNRRIKGAYKQTMKALTIFNDYISLKQVIGYMCTIKSEQ